MYVLPGFRQVTLNVSGVARLCKGGSLSVAAKDEIRRVCDHLSRAKYRTLTVRSSRCVRVRHLFHHGK